MWRKPNEVKPSSQPSPMPAASPMKSEESPKMPAPAPSYQQTPRPSAPVSAPTPAPVSSNISKITSGLKIQGELSGDSDLYIDGDVQGKIRLVNAKVTVGPSGRVRAEIEAREISVDGSVQGNLKASEAAHFGPSSRVEGSVLTPRLGIEDGARLRGKIETIRAPQSAKPVVNETSESEELHPETIGAKTE